MDGFNGMVLTCAMIAIKCGNGVGSAGVKAPFPAGDVRIPFSRNAGRNTLMKNEKLNVRCKQYVLNAEDHAHLELSYLKRFSALKLCQC